MKEIKFVSALRFKWLTPLYDFLLSVTMPEKNIKNNIIKNANFNSHEIVLDFGCGTSTLTIMAKEHQPSINIIGIDIDQKILDQATKKINQKGLEIKLIKYNGDELPFEDGSFDSIISCLVFHHLKTPVKQKVLCELYRIMKVGGHLIIADFGQSNSWYQRLLFYIIRCLDGFKPTHANAKGLMPLIIANAGFINPIIKQRFKTFFGEVQIFNAIKQ